MISEQKFWNPVLETLDREKIRKLKFEKFKKMKAVTDSQKKELESKTIGNEKDIIKKITISVIMNVNRYLRVNQIFGYIKD